MAAFIMERLLIAVWTLLTYRHLLGLQDHNTLGIMGTASI